MSKVKTSKKPAAKSTSTVKAKNHTPPGKSKKAEVVTEELGTVVIEAVETTDEADMSALLDELDSAAMDTSLVEAATVETVEPIDAEEVYAAMESDLAVVDEAEAEAVAKTRKSKGKVAKAKRETVKAGESAPRRAVDPERLAAIVGEEEARRLISGVTALPVKIRDKAVNAVAAITSGSSMSGYTQYAIEHLRKAEGQETTSKGIIEMYRNRGYSPGTAAAQAQQQMVLLDYLGVAKRDGRILKLNADAPLTAAIAA